MSIRKRLLLSNVGMIVLPIIGFLFIEILLGYVIFYLFGVQPQGNDLGVFLTLRFMGIVLVLLLTNGLLTYYVSKSIIQPIQHLMRAAKEISEGNLDYKLEPMKRQDELSQLAETFESMRKKLKAASELQDRYAENQRELMASISHDLKTPLTSIKGYVKGMKDGVANTPEKMTRYLDTIDKKAEDMDTLIDELFLYSKLELQSLPFHFEEVDLQAYMADFIEELRMQLEEEGGTVSFDAEEGESYFARADRDQLKRVVTNISQNSLKYMDKEKKEILVRLKAYQKDWVLVEMRDNGIGIAEEAISSVFDRFYRTDLSRNSSTGGSGLGLAIAKKIIQEHGGEIWAESEAGEGTGIFFTLKKSQKAQGYHGTNTNH
jgi:histidine kinase